MNVRKDIVNTIAELKRRREFKNQAEIATFLNYNVSYFSRTLNADDIPIDFEETFFRAFPRSKYLSLSENTTKHIDPESQVKIKPEKSSRVIDLKDLHSVKTYIIPIKGRAGLQCNYYDDVMFEELETEELLTNDAHFGKYFKVEVEGDSMDNGGPKDLQHGDWAYCRSVPKQYWRDKLHFNKYRIWCFFHNERGIIFKSIISHNSETGELELKSLNEDKDQYPNFKINVGECSYICNVVKKISSL